MQLCKEKYFTFATSFSNKVLYLTSDREAIFILYTAVKPLKVCSDLSEY